MLDTSSRHWAFSGASFNTLATPMHRNLIHASAKVLVGNVQEGDQCAVSDHLDYIIPLGGGQVRADRIVAARVQ